VFYTSTWMNLATKWGCVSWFVNHIYKSLFPFPLLWVISLSCCYWLPHKSLTGTSQMALGECQRCHQQTPMIFRLFDERTQTSAGQGAKPHSGTRNMRIPRTNITLQPKVTNTKTGKHMQFQHYSSGCRMCMTLCFICLCVTIWFYSLYVPSCLMSEPNSICRLFSLF